LHKERDAMATNRLFIYDNETNSAVCIAKGHTSGWGRIRDNYSSERWFDEIVEEYPGNLGEMCSGDTKLELKTEGSLPKTCNVLSYESEKKPSCTVEAAQTELEYVRELNRENAGKVQARDRIINDLKSQISRMEEGIKDHVMPEVLCAVNDERVKLQDQVSKLIDILHTKEKGYFD